MKYLSRHLLSLTVGTLSLFFCGPKDGAVQAESQVLVTPDTLIITSTKKTLFESEKTATRTLALRATDAVENLNIYAFDLYNSDRDRVFESRLITVATEPTDLKADSLEHIPIQFDLSEAPSGEFQGNLLIRYPANEITVPVIVRVKDAWPLPLLLLVLGVVLGSTISSYSRHGRNIDEIAAEIDQLKSQRENDRDILPSFATSISTHLTDARIFRESKQLPKARKSISDARTLWRKWIRQREAWLSLGKQASQLQERLKASSEISQTRYAKAIQTHLNETLAAISSFSEASLLAEQLNQVSHQLFDYQQLMRESMNFQKNLELFSPEQTLDSSEASEVSASNPNVLRALKLQAQAADLQQRLSRLLPNQSSNADDDSLQLLETELTQLIQQFKTLQLEMLKTDRTGSRIEAVLTENLEAFSLGDGKSASLEVPVAETAAEPAAIPKIDSPSEESEDDNNPVIDLISWLIPSAKQRLQLFSTIGYATTIVFLAGTGFNQLYLERATFGEAGPSDYFSLLAWGFGAEATRSAVAAMLKEEGQK